WLKWTREIQALAQTGETYAENGWQSERYARLMAIAAEITAAHSDMDEKRLLETFQSERGYATPKVDVRAAAFRDGDLLMVREISDGRWTLPGGWADVGDIPSEAAERETWEESGYQVKATKLIGLYDANRSQPMAFFHAYKIIFLCEIVDGDAKISSETSEVAFFSESEIPKDLSLARTPKRVIKDCFTAYADQSIDTKFD
ncbi:MAG: NUDIX hydrolase, partial [Chloroflexota bacterium]